MGKVNDYQFNVFQNKKHKLILYLEFFLALHLVDIKHLFLDRIQGCFDALEKKYVRMF